MCKAGPQRNQRLAKMAVTNCPASIRGLPVISESDANKIARAVVYVQGHCTKKARESLDNDRQGAVPKPLKLKTTSTKWAEVFKCDHDWTSDQACFHEDLCEKMETITCSVCGRAQDIRNQQVSNKRLASNHKCKSCGVVHNICLWYCRCNRLWLKCP